MFSAQLLFFWRTGSWKGKEVGEKKETFTCLLLVA